MSKGEKADPRSRILVVFLIPHSLMKKNGLRSFYNSRRCSSERHNPWEGRQTRDWSQPHHGINPRPGISDAVHGIDAEPAHRIGEARYGKAADAAAEAWCESDDANSNAVEDVAVEARKDADHRKDAEPVIEPETVAEPFHGIMTVI